MIAQAPPAPPPARPCGRRARIAVLLWLAAGLAGLAVPAVPAAAAAPGAIPRGAASPRPAAPDTSDGPPIAARVPTDDARAVITGLVRASDTGLPVAGATVEVRGAGMETRALTAADGRFRLAGLAGGPHEVRVRHVGFRPATVTLEARADGAGGGEPVEPVVELERMPVPLARLVVTPGHYGVMGQEAAATSTLTREQLLQAPQVGEDLFRVVSRLPGISSSDFSAAFRVRGAAPEELLVTLDGVRLHEPFHLKDLDGALSIVDLGAVGGVELNTGGFGARWGDGLSGVMEIATLDPEPGRPAHEVALTLTTLRGTSRGRLAGDRTGWLVSARQGFLEYALQLAGEGRDVRPRYHDLLAKVVHAPAPGHEIGAHLLVADDGLRYTDPAEPALLSQYGSRYLWGTWTWDAGSRLRAHTVLSVARLTWARDGQRVSDLESIVDLNLRDRRALTVAALRHDWTFAASERALLAWGVEAQRSTATYDYQRGRLVLGERDGRLVIGRDSVSLDLAPEATTAGAYVTQRLRATDRLAAEVGLRVDRHASRQDGGERDDDVVLQPRVALAWTPGWDATVRLAWGRYARGHAAHELQAGDGLTGLAAPDLAEQRVVGVERRVVTGVTARLEAYDRLHDRVRARAVSMDEALDLFPETGPARALLAAGTSRARGVELLVSSDRGGPVSWSAGYALARAWDTVDGAEVASPFDQRHTVTASLAYRPADRWVVSVAGVYHSGWPTTAFELVADTLGSTVIVTTREFGPRNAERLPGYHRVDARVTRRFDVGRGRLSAFVDVFNLFDRRNPRVRDTALLTPFARRFDTFLPRVPSFGATWEF